MELTIIGGGAAGLMAAIWAARTNPDRRIVVLDGAARLGAKILIAGGGRCNVTHYQVTADDFCGGSRNAIKKLLARFPAEATVELFAELGVRLKREETGKLFPTTNRAQTVLDALINEARRLNVSILTKRRVTRLAKNEDGTFSISGEWGEIVSPHVILATGGKSVPKTGSDGFGWELAKRLGHTLTPRIFPALVPLVAADDWRPKELSGVSLPAELSVHSGSGKRLRSVTGDLLFTHRGLSGPAVLDISRHFLDALQDDPQTQLRANWLPGEKSEEFDAELQALGPASIRKLLREKLPARLADLLLELAEIDPERTGDQLDRAARQRLVRMTTAMETPIVGNRGFAVAEATAGGIPLDQIQLKTMESRVCPGLFLCGEICDVDGRIGGFNFQWAWSSGHVAGVSA
ncbi:aminoacetone oxidase family FAD-binding enzyme [Blastopirellula sp. JC732]|uniref:Aminoacetone oxidase family FAD-binding enzyme n=1 Tax=Blastopirellula sediminis TaxID=2894196 RepID=A0A9X1MUF3_9BACT|nr:aminoacetone oxidase family FAD-binding enzyme [Blastopirellula sediminis]MCC9604896.1 aminoacetone oxidase family FAD-binding enzyme [Blastopirellula sediminis]MCC9631804.1 aminoacetone oxidase family FAD-binding enzyme [Blastopirellula sediminis]